MTAQSILNGIATPEDDRWFVFLAARVDQFIAGAEHDNIKTRLVNVLGAIPRTVARGLLEDPRFRIAVDDFAPERGRTVWLSCPAPGGRGSRCVVLKGKLGGCPAAFAHYVIAHELAHAHLRNGAWGAMTDPEEAADAVAASWGFAAPT